MGVSWVSGLWKFGKRFMQIVAFLAISASKNVLNSNCDEKRHDAVMHSVIPFCYV